MSETWYTPSPNTMSDTKTAVTEEEADPCAARLECYPLNGGLGSLEKPLCALVPMPSALVLGGRLGAFWEHFLSWFEMWLHVHVQFGPLVPGEAGWDVLGCNSSVPTLSVLIKRGCALPWSVSVPNQSLMVAQIHLIRQQLYERGTILNTHFADELRHKQD